MLRTLPGIPTANFYNAANSGPVLIDALTSWGSYTGYYATGTSPCVVLWWFGFNDGYTSTINDSFFQRAASLTHARGCKAILATEISGVGFDTAGQAFTTSARAKATSLWALTTSQTLAKQ